MNSVVVLLSAYNGDKYIKEQLDSIVNQDFSGNITIQIRDDGSTKGNIEKIVSNYTNDASRQVILYKGNNVGPQKSFLWLIEHAVEADYYFFADQDDVWKSNKIAAAVKALEMCDTPTLYCSNYSLVDAELKIIQDKFISKEPVFEPLRSFFYNRVPGCCMTWNKSLQNLLAQMHVNSVMMHDRYVVSFACIAGNVIYDPESYILHRIHGDNVIGNGPKKFHLGQWITEKWNVLQNGEGYSVEEMAAQFIHATAYSGNNKDCTDIKLLQHYKKPYINTIKLSNKLRKYERKISRETISIQCKVLLHLI